MKEDTILLVEDREDDIILILEALKECRIMNKIVIAKDGEEALDYLFARGKYTDRDFKKTPSIILLDLKLPKLDGIEVLKEIRRSKKTKVLPVVILTSSKEEKDLINGYKFGCNSYVVKPVDFAKFTEAIKNLGLYWLLINERPLGEN